MKKIPTLFKRVFENHRIKEILPEVDKSLEWVLNGEGIATVKYDGSCCAVINGELYKRYDARKGKPVPEGAIKCQEEPDPVTGHLPCWVKCDRNEPADKWFWAAFDTAKENGIEFKCNLTYEAIGKHFNGNPYNLPKDFLTQHGVERIVVGRSFEEIKEYLRTHEIEGIVFWKDGEPKCKIKRTDFGYSWPIKKEV